MIPYPNIDPDIIRIGPLAIRWYGLMYALGFGASYLLVKYQIKKQRRGAEGKAPDIDIPGGFLDSLYTYLVIGLILGARLGYVLFYDLANYVENPGEILAVWRGGLSFHGGLIGCLGAGFLCTRKYSVDFWRAADLVIVTAPLALALGRIGNFINGELFGRVTDVSWGMVFPEGGPLPRHPSQLYEFALEGVLLFLILWTVKNKKFAPGTLCGLFMILYGVFRCFVEFFREPDPQIGFIAGFFTMGQVLSILTALAGYALIAVRKRSIETKS